MNKDYENWIPPKGQLEMVIKDGKVSVKRCIDGIPVGMDAENVKIVYEESPFFLKCTRCKKKVHIMDMSHEHCCEFVNKGKKDEM